MISLIECLGLAGGTLTTFSFLPQAIKIWQTRDVSSISLLMYSIFCVGVMFWLIYGIALGSIALIIANGITLCFSTSILFLKIYIGAKNKKREDD
ncbi:MAG: hypothetical protein BGO67_11245 [Alphaproteobacteria bacterium 41-28]|nr:MAG: hypothetical protein BGO67_11245 [Alphaproteobacteria bacterium 41-28]